MSTTHHPNYCPMFFKSMFVQRQDSGHVQMSHCCVGPMGEITDRVEFDRYGLFRTNRREWHLAPTPGCEVCWRPEQQGHHSFRRGWLAWLDENPDLDPLQPELIKLDYNVGPICNARCVHCSSLYSSSWAAEDARFGQPAAVSFKQISQQDVVGQIDVTRLRTMYINGGEPFMSDDPQRLLRRVQQHGNISDLKFQSNTNGSVRPTPEMIDLWLQCREVDIFVSIDATEEQFEYVRYPLKWQTVVDNIDFMSQIDSRIRVKFSFALGIHNIDEMPRTWQWFLDHRGRRHQDETAFGIHQCYGRLDLENASTELAQTWRDQLDPQGYWTPWAMSLVDRARSDDDEIWMTYLDDLDQRRGLQWRRALPGLARSLEKSRL